MTQLPEDRRSYDDESQPLGPILEGLPQEKPPAGLKDQVLRAVRAEEAAMKPKPAPLWPMVLRMAGAGAGVFLILTLLVPVMTRSRNKARLAPTASMQMSEEAKSGAMEGAPGGPGQMEETPPAAGEAMHAAQPSATPAAPGAPAMPRAAKPAPAPPPGEYGGGDYERNDSITQQPWHDYSGDRQKRTHQEMELQVRDVQDAYDRSTSIIRKEGGYIETEDLRVENHGPNRAHLEARVPVDKLAGTVAQLRELGKVVKLAGESEDVSEEYYGRGEEVRGMGASEDTLVQQYEAEKNRARKAELFRQIQALREQNKGQKRPLLQLSKETHFALLDLTLVEPGGPGKFLGTLGESATTAAGWLAVSAVIWLPLLILAAVIWRRKR
jgi:hypothetical protein